MAMKIQVGVTDSEKKAEFFFVSSLALGAVSS